MSFHRYHVLAFAVVVGMHQTVYAQSSTYNIASAPLSQTMAQIARQNGVSLSADPELLKGKIAPTLQGNYDIDTAFKIVLAGSGLQLVKNSDGTVYSLKKLEQQEKIQMRDVGQLKTFRTTAFSEKTDPSQLPLITLHAATKITEGSKSYTTDKMSTATKLDLTLRETPQSVMVISQQMLLDRKIDDFQTLMQTTTGVSTEKNADGRYVYYSRGFNVDYYLFDGIPITQGWYTINNYNLDLFDRVEIVKGANGLLAGAGNPAVSINMIRKHANSKEFKANVEASYGRWDMYKLKTDIQTPLNQDGSVRARLIASYKDKNLFIDKSSQENMLIYGVIDADITDNTEISFGTSYEENNNKGVMGGNILPAFFTDETKTNFNRSKSYMFDWSKWHTNITSYFFDTKHHFSNDISLNLSYFYNEIETKDRIVTDISGSLNKDGTGLIASDSKYPQHIQKNNLDIYSSIPFELIDRNHEVILGIQYNKQNDKRYLGENSYSYPIENFFIENGSEINPQDYGMNILNRNSDTEQKSAYLTGKFELNNDLKVILGSRLTNWSYNSYNYFTESTTQYKNNHVFTPFLGIVYDINKYHSLYASYTNIFQPQDYKNQAGSLLDPKQGKNYEIGIKSEYFNQKLNTGLTLFKLKQNNVAEAIDGVFVDGSGGSEQAYKGVKGIESQGVEFEISGKLTDALDINLGFTHFEAKDADRNNVNTTVPRNNFNIFSKYSFDKLSLGAGLNWKSKGYSRSEALEIKQRAYAVVDLMAHYDFSNHFSGQLNIYNLFNKKYYAGYNASNYSYAEPLNILASLKYQF